MRLAYMEVSRLLAGEVEDFAAKWTDNDVEEPSNGPGSRLHSHKVIPLHHIFSIEKHGYGHGTQIQHVPQGNLAGKRIIRYSTIYCVVGDENVVGNQRKSWTDEALETLRW